MARSLEGYKSRFRKGDEENVAVMGIYMMRHREMRPPSISIKLVPP